MTGRYCRCVARPGESRSLRVLVDSRVAGSATGLTVGAPLPGGDSVEVTVFDEYTSAPDISALLGSLAPHVVVVDRVRLDISSMLIALVRLHPGPPPRTVLGVCPLDDMHKVEAAYHGFDDVVDLGRRADSILVDLVNVARGGSSLDRDALWTRVSRPLARPEVLSSPQDDLDRRIIDLICIGLPDKEIAEVTHHSHQTIRNRISGLLQRTGLSNRTQMAWLHNSQVLAALMLANLDRRAPTIYDH